MDAGADRVYRLTLIGPFGLFAPDGGRIDIRSKKGCAVMALLAMSPDGVRSRAWLQEMLWGSRSTREAQGSLRRELSTLANVLAEHGASHLLHREHSRVSLNLQALRVDAVDLGTGLVERRNGAPRDMLEGLDLRDSEGFEDWLRDQRSRFHDLQRFSVTDRQALQSAAQVLGEALPPTASLLTTASPRLPPKPSVAVLPLETRGDREGADDILGIALAEEIELTLAQFKTLFVVSTGSTRVLLQRQMTLIEIARRLGVRYLIDGVVHKEQSRVRVLIKLIDGHSGHQVWAQHFPEELDSMLSLQQRIARAVAPIIHTKIDIEEIDGGLRRPVMTGDVYTLYWRANALFRKWEKPAILEAITVCDALLALDPACASGSAMAAFCYAMAYGSKWTDDLEAARHAAIVHYQNAIRHGGDDPTVLGYAAGTLVLLGGDIATADRLISRALSLLPAYQPTLFWGGWVDIALGNAARARERFELSLRINPEAGVRAYTITGIGVALLMLGDVAQAYEMLAASVAYIPTYPMTLAALAVCAAALGKAEEASRARQVLNATGGIEQVLRVVTNPAHRSVLTAGLMDMRSME